MELAINVARLTMYLVIAAGILTLIYTVVVRVSAAATVEVESLNETFYERQKELGLTSKIKGKYKEKEKHAYVIDFNGDIQATQIKGLREVVNTILYSGKKNSEVVVRIKSGGGSATAYSYASTLLERLRNSGFRVTTCIDEIAASGGYMMAAVGHQILASKESLVGSIGVVAEFPNVVGMFDKLGIKWLEYTAGEHKRSVSPFKKPETEDEEHLKEKLEKMHKAFKEHVIEYRPHLRDKKVFDGDYWLAVNAIGLGLVDQIMTSDDYIFQLMKDHEVYTLKYEEHKGFMDKMFGKAEVMFKNIIKDMINESRSTNNL